MLVSYGNTVVSEYLRMSIHDDRSIQGSPDSARSAQDTLTDENTLGYEMVVAVLLSLESWWLLSALETMDPFIDYSCLACTSRKTSEAQGIYSRICKRDTETGQTICNGMTTTSFRQRHTEHVRDQVTNRISGELKYTSRIEHALNSPT